MVRAASTATRSITGARPALIPWSRRLPCRASGARTVRTETGVVLFDERGRYVGVVASISAGPAFGPGAETVLLSREG